MIKDKLENINRYSINEHFEDFKKFINQSIGDDLSSIEKPLKAIPLEYLTGDFNLGKFENHQQFIDIHYIIKGKEVIGLTPIDELSPNMNYDDKNDYQLFDGVVQETIQVSSGEFLLLLPGEAHVTGGIVNDLRNMVKKIVFKVPI